MGNGLSVVPVPASDLFDRFKGIRPYLESFVERSEGAMTLEMVLSNILQQDQQCWVVEDGGHVSACALTRILRDETNTCVITHCAGEGYEQWAEPLLTTIRDWSREVGSTKLEAVTRPGWERVLKRLGMVKTHVILEYRDNGQG